MPSVPVITMSLGYPIRQVLTHVVSHQCIWEPLGPRSQVSLEFYVKCISDILRVQHIPPAKRDTESNAPRQAPQRDWGKECEDHTGYLYPVMHFIGTNFERVAFDMGRAGRAGADLDDATREQLIIGERINPRNNIRTDVLLRYQTLLENTHLQ